VWNDYLEVEALSAAIHLICGGIIGAGVITAFLAGGVQGDMYDPQNNKVDLLASAGAVQNAPANTSPPAPELVSVNDSQPYPITGWLEAKWVASSVVAKP
jgi:hypothetical protein